MGQDQHASMFAAAIIMQPRWLANAAHLLNQADLIKGPMCPTHQIIMGNAKGR